METSEIEARRLLSVALERYSDLSIDGFVSSERQWGWSMMAIARSSDWIRRIDPIKTHNLKQGSYFYKHAVECWRRDLGDEDPYVSNGEFIAAALGLGWSPMIDGPNVYFKFSQRSIKNICGPRVIL